MPIHPALKAAFKNDYLNFALSGGEDYELLFTARRDVISEVMTSLNCPITVIGEIVTDKPGMVTLLDEEGKVVEWERGGWEHFASGGNSGASRSHK